MTTVASEVYKNQLMDSVEKERAFDTIQKVRENLMEETINNHSGVYCIRCDVDIMKYPDHMCGNDPIVQADEKTLEPFPEWKYGFRCKYCYSGVGRQHYNCKLLKTRFRKFMNVILGINYK
jgi:hypothetical protein